ncbi:HWE histidine kinase domain-containing protein [Novosphingobium sp. Chol11]|uniref:sensor histidine kinase n=1 Tax=Novosphingobium sp. Chol11 TaxID=1385763 RepID=UPI0025DB1D96|nr:HWE histidine kinase domain-containing protein [Novosphingobium sp. Chol11]
MSITDLVPRDKLAAFTADLLVKIGEASHHFIYAKDLDSRMVYANHAVLKALGRTWDEIRGRSDLEWHDDLAEAQKFVAADARVMAMNAAETLEEVLTGEGAAQTYLSTKCPIHDAEGEVIGMFGVSMNITERRNAETLRRLLVGELEHRVRNTLTVVQAIARLTLKDAVADKSVWKSFENRIQAMASAQGLLTRERWEGADLRAIVAESLQVHGGVDSSRFDVQGESVWIDAQTALAIAMAFHELGTNAIKYGALSVAHGRVAIRWHIDRAGDVPRLTLSWTESGGPAVAARSHTGFGSILIEQAFAPHGSDVARVKFLPGGVVFEAHFELPGGPLGSLS